MQTKRSSLFFKIIVGSFLVMIIAGATAPFWMTGGAYAISPNGQYCLHVTSALNPNYFSYYTISLRRQLPDIATNGNRGSPKQALENQLPNMANETIETITVRPHSFPMSCPRGHVKPVRWSPESDFVDVYIDDKPLCRVYVRT